MATKKNYYSVTANKGESAAEAIARLNRQILYRDEENFDIDPRLDLSGDRNGNQSIYGRMKELGLGIAQQENRTVSPTDGKNTSGENPYAGLKERSAVVPSAAQRVEAPDFSTENSVGITRTEKNSPTKSSGLPFAANAGFSMGVKTPVFMNNQLGLNREEAADNRAAATENAAVATAGQSREIPAHSDPYYVLQQLAQQKAQEDIAAAKQKEKVSVQEWLSGLNDTAYNAAIGVVPYYLNGLVSMGVDWLENHADVAGVLGINDKAMVNSKIREITGTTPGYTDPLDAIYLEKQNNAADIASRSKSAEIVYPIAENLARNVRLLFEGAALGIPAEGSGAAMNLLKSLTGDKSKNGLFLLDVLENAGVTYREKKAEGVDDDAAMLSSILAAIPNSMIEFSGGDEEIIRDVLNGTFQQELKNALKRVGLSALEEAGEEILQDPIQGIVDKAIYDKDKKISADSLTDPTDDAIFNMARMLRSAGYAAASTLIGAGGGTVVQSTMNRVMSDADIVSVGKSIREQDGGQQLLQIAERSEDEAVQRQAEEIRRKLYRGENISAYSLGRLAEAIGNDATVDIGSAAREIGTAGNTQQQVMQQYRQETAKEEAVPAATEKAVPVQTVSAPQEARQNLPQQVISVPSTEGYAATLGENGKKAFNMLAENLREEDIPGMRNAFQAYYDYGQWGQDIKNVDTSFRSFIDEAGAYAAYSAGRNDAAATVAKAQERLQAAENGTQAKVGNRPGLAANLASRAVSAAERSYLDQIGWAFNVSIEMYTADTATEGNGYTAGGKIYLNTNSTNKLAGVINHELTHIMQERSPKEYQQYRDLVAAYVDRQERGWFDSQVERMIDGYAKRGQQITREEAVDEVVADASERFLSDEEAINTLVKENRSVARKVLDALREIIRKLSELVHGEGFDTRAAEVLSRDMEVYREAEKLWVKALSESSEARTVNENETRYQLVEDAEGNKVVLIQKNIFEGHEGESRIKVVRDYLRQHIGEVYTIIESGQKVYLGKDLPDEYTRSKYTQNINGNTRYAKNQAAQVMGEMIEISSNRRWEKTKHAQKHASDARYGFYKYTTRFAIKNGAEVYSADLVIRNANDGSKYLYDIINIKRNNSLPLAAAPQGSRQISPDTKNVGGVSPAVSYTNIISETGEEVKEFSEGKKYQLVDYDERQKENWKNSKNIVLYESQEQFSDFIDGALSGSITGKKMYFGIVPKDLARKIKDVVDIETAGYNITLRSDEIRKIIKDHGNARKEAFRGQRGITKEDLLSIPNIIQSPDAIEDGGIYEGKPAIQFRKTIHGRTVVVTYVSRKHMDITVQTMYGGTKIESLATAADEQASANTPEALRGTTLNTYSIPQEQQLFNPENSEEKKFQFSGDEFDWLDDGDMDENGAGYEWLDEQIDGAISGDDDGTITAQLAAVRAETKALEGNRLDEQQVNRVVKEVLRSYSSKYSAEKMAEVVNDALSAIRSRGNAGFAESVAAVYARAKAAVEASERLDKSLWDAEDVKSIRQTIRGTRMYVSEKERGDFKDGYNNYRRETFGTFKLTGDPADMSVDQVYTELSTDYPGYFDGEAVSAHEQLEAMRDFLTAVRPTYTNEFEGNVEETALDMTAELLHQASAAAQERNVSEAIQADRSRQAKKYAENKKKLREKYTAKYKAGIQAEREKGAQRAASAKEQYQKELTQQKEKYEARSERQKAGYEKREAEWKEQKQRLRDQSAGYRERIKTIREQNKQSRKAATDRRITAQIRHKIEKVVMNLGKELEHPTDTKHVPVELRGTVAAFLNTLDLSAQQDGLAVSPFKETQRQAAWRKLRDTCEKIIDEEAGDSESWYIVVDPDIVSRIDDLLSSGAIYHLNELNREQAEELYKLVRAIDHMVRYTDKVRLEGQMVSATETARGIIEENQSRMKENRRMLEALNKAEGFFKYDLLDPTRFSDMFGERFHDLFHNLRAAENQKISRWAEVEEYFGKLADENGFKENELRKLEEDYKEFTVGNSRIRLSTAQVMSLYLTNKREQGRSHLYAGGISLPDEREGTKVRENRRSYRITEAEVEAIIGTLSDAQRKLADGMQAFASGQMSNWGNEASMYLYGYKKFTEKNYWPISSDPNYTRSEVSLQQAAAKNASLKNQGMTKALVEKASNPIRIDSAFDVFARHGTQMAAYSAYVGPLEDLNKVINWQTRHDGNWRSVRETLSGVGGSGALRYLNRFIDDVNGQAAGESSPYEGLMGAAKAASIAGNMRVVVQQPTAYWRAMAVIPPKHLLSGIAGHRVDADEMHSVAPITLWKEWGYFRDGASGSNLKELMVGKKGVKDRFVDKTMALAGKADDMTWKQLYRAVENWVSADGLERGTEEYRQEVGKRFTDVVDRTQVVDSVFQRAQTMRNNGFGWKMATAFMAEPLKSYNLLVGSFRQIGIAGDKKTAVKRAVMATVGFIASTLINAVVQSAWDVGRDKDPEETRADKFFQALLGDGVYAAIKDGESLGGNAYEVSLALLGGNLQGGLNPLNLIPVAKDVLSFYEGNDVQVMGLSAIADLMTAANNLAEAAGGDSKKYTTGYYAVQLARKLSAATGLPVGNIYREIESLINFTVTTFEEKTGVNASKLRFELDKLYLSPSGSRSVYYNLMYAARRDGNNELAAEVGNFLLTSGVSRQAIDNAMLSRIEKDAALSEVIVGYAEAYQAMDSRRMQALIDEAENAGISGDELHRAAKRLIPSDDGEGEETGEAFTADNLGDEVQMTDSYQVEALTNSLLSGDRANADAFNQSLLDAGKEQKEIDSSVKAQLKKRMLESMGYESEKEMQEAGAEFDTGAEEYRYLHDHYGYTQYGYDDLVQAYLSGDGYDAIYRDMLGQQSSGENVYTAEGMEKELKSRIQQEFNAVYYGGTGSGWEQYRDALKKLGKSWDEILDSYKRSNAGKEWLRE